jgi:hypothetical protein
MKMAMPPAFCAAIMAKVASSVLPDAGGPAISMMRPPAQPRS